MIVIGLTGSVGMGKSVTAGMLVEEGGGALQSADAVVHALYAADGEAAAVLGAVLPDVIDADGSVDRPRLRARVQAEPELLERVEEIVHPLVRRERERFLARAESDGAPFAVLEIPLLFETGSEREVDVVVVASAPESVQRERVLARPGMTEAMLRGFLAKQTPDAEKRIRADYVVETGEGLEAARAQVRQLLVRLGLASRPISGGVGD